MEICIPDSINGEFDCLFDAIKFAVLNDRDIYHTLRNIVQYNVRFRRILQNKDVGLLIFHLTNEDASLGHRYFEKHLLDLYNYFNNNPIADYNIQCYNIKDDVTILGHTFHGLDDIVKHIEISCECKDSETYIYRPDELEEYPDIHVGCIYEHYPVFDIFDMGDRRTYQNYIFRKESITDDELTKTLKINHNFNFCMVHEEIDNDLLPILYYSGDGNYMLLATKRELTKKSQNDYFFFNLPKNNQ